MMIDMVVAKQVCLFARDHTLLCMRNARGLELVNYFGGNLGN